MQIEKVKIITVDEDHAGQRIDNFLLRFYRKVPKSRIYRAIRKGEVRVNKKRIKATYRVLGGDQVRVPPMNQPNQAQVEVKHDTKQLVKQSTIYEDDELLVIDKPSGMAVHGGSGLSYGVIESLRQSYPTHQYLELIHRLDRETSGILLVAKRPRILRECHALLRQNAMDKKYKLLVKGRWPEDLTRVSLPLKKNILVSNERIVTVDPSGKPSVTHFDVIERYEDATLLQATLKTGRTHQLRVHTAHHGHPIVGDEKYGDQNANQQFQALGLKRLFLHAESIAFQLQDHAPYQFIAELPQHMQDICTKLRKVRA